MDNWSGPRWETVNRASPSPGQGTRGKETMGHYGSGRDRERTKLEVSKRYIGGADAESAPARQRDAWDNILAHSGRDSPCARSNSITVFIIVTLLE